MPPVGGFVALTSALSGGRGGGGSSFSFSSIGAQSTQLFGDFSKIEFTPNFDSIKGRLIINFNSSRISHNGIRVRLEGHLDLNERNAENLYSPPIDIFKERPIETILTCKSIDTREILHFASCCFTLCVNSFYVISTS